MTTAADTSRPSHPLPTEQDGYEALRAHIVAKAAAARQRHGTLRDEADVRRLLADPEVVRFPTALVFDAGALLAGEFAWARPRGERPSAGFDLVVHPCFRDLSEALPLLVAYHVPSINYLDVATHAEAELFGATLLGLDVEEYYQRLCRYADSLPIQAPVVPASFLATGELPAAATPDAGSSTRREPATAATGGGCGSGACGCAAGRTKDQA